MKASLRCILASLITTTGVVILDLWTKAVWFKTSQPWRLLEPVLMTTQHRNYGLIANIPAPAWLIVIVSIAVLIGAGFMFWRAMTRSTAVAVGFGFLCGGAIGNGFDRISLGYVRDWILAFRTSAFNIADIAVAIGLIVLLWNMHIERDLSPDREG